MYNIVRYLPILMEDGGSIVEFFYNIVPGSIFIFLLWYFGIIGTDLISFPENSEALKILAILVASLFFGFVFQGITIVFRQAFWNKKAFREIKCESIIFDEVKKHFLEQENLDKDKFNNEDFKYLFYLMDNRLRGHQRAFLPTYFSSLFAFWSNLLCACFLFLLFLAIDIIAGSDFESTKTLFLLVIFVVMIAACYFSNKFLKSFYDTILNAYYVKFVMKEKS